jgi:CRISPR-associated protein Cmr1
VEDPVLSRTHTLAGVNGGEAFTDWAAVAEYAGLQLRSFRRLHGPRAAAVHALTSEPGAATDADPSRFPAAVLGLPVLSGFSEINAYRGDLPLRRPSTLWLRPVGEADHWRLLSYAFCGQFLPGPQAPEVREVRANRRGERKLTVTDDDITALATQWINTLASDGTFT